MPECVLILLAGPHGRLPVANALTSTPFEFRISLGPYKIRIIMLKRRASRLLTKQFVLFILARFTLNRLSLLMVCEAEFFYRVQVG